MHGELWVGASPGLPEWADALTVEVRDVAELASILDGCRGAMTTPTTPHALVAAHALGVDHRLSSELSDLRMVPTAVDGLGERWLQGTFDRHARTFDNGPGYAGIVGSGPHAPTLHWVRCDGPVLADAPLLLDLGVEANSLYTADVTRTVPLSGSFSPVQREIHDIVERAHRAGMAQVRPGALYSDFHFAAMVVVASGLYDVGLLGVSVDEALSPNGQQHRRYLVCGIVIRLEDDLLVTDRGAEVLSGALPIDAAGVERWAQQHLGSR